jgi:outer membrane scaffolding protein for murein synthesis (MipA/OmpV family)
LAAPAARAELLPLWEAGAGLATISLPDYRGARERSNYVLPLPYFVYRGERLKADREGLRGTLFDSDRVEVNLSLNATLPVNSDDSQARRGMTDLKPTVELGPTVNLTLWRSAGRDMKLDFRAPVRTAITLESSPKQIGWLFSPSLNLDIRDPTGFAGWNLGILTGPIFSNREYNAHFYSVGAADATAQRPAYAAPGGYAGSQFTLGLSRRFARYWVGAFLRYDTLAGASFAASPLVARTHGVAAGFGISWILGESTRLVAAPQ